MLNKGGAHKIKIRVMTNQELKKFIIEYPENQYPECMDSCDEWFNDLLMDVKQEFNLNKITDELVELVDEICDEL